MAVHSKNSRLAIMGRNYSCEATSATMTYEDQQAVVTAFCDEGVKTITGLDQGSMSVTYFADDLADGTEWSTRFGEEKTLATFAPAGFAVGRDAWSMESTQTRHQAGSQVGDAVAFSLDLASQGLIDVGGKMLLDASSTALTSSSGVVTTVDGGALSSNGGAGYLHVFASGTGSMTVKIQDSSNGSTWADLVTFAAATAAGAQRVEVTGTVDRYLRATWTISGGSAAFLAVAAFARR